MIKINKNSQTPINKQTFLCDICGKVKSGKKFPIFDENWNKYGSNQCEDCSNMINI